MVDECMLVALELRAIKTEPTKGKIMYNNLKPSWQSYIGGIYFGLNFLIHSTM